MGHSRREFLKYSVIGTVGAIPVAGAGARLIASPQTGVTEAFFRAVREGDLAKLKQMLSEHSSLLRATDEARRTAFANAYLHGHEKVGAYLSSVGYEPDTHEAALALDWERFSALAKASPAEVNQDHPIGGTAMYAAAAGGAGSDIWRIYAAQGDPNIVPGGRRAASPLQIALRYEDLGVAEMTASTLIGNNTRPHGSNDADASPLHIAAERGSVELAEMLVRLGADVADRDSEGRTAEELARVSGHLAIANLLERHSEIARTHSTSRTAYDVNGRPYAPPDVSSIPAAARGAFVGNSHGNMASVQEALGKDTRMAHSVATTGEICVEAGAHMGQKPIVEVLLENGATYSLPTAVMRSDRKRVVELLDEDPLRIHERGAHDFALMWYPVIGRCDLDMMQLLMDRGARVEEQHYLGTTALHFACLRGPIELVELLIENGANVNRRGRKFSAEGNTPLQLALSRDQSEIARLLKSRGAKA